MRFDRWHDPAVRRVLCAAAVQVAAQEGEPPVPRPLPGGLRQAMRLHTVAHEAAARGEARGWWGRQRLCRAQQSRASSASLIENDVIRLTGDVVAPTTALKSGA